MTRGAGRGGGFGVDAALYLIFDTASVTFVRILHESSIGICLVASIKSTTFTR